MKNRNKIREYLRGALTEPQERDFVLQISRDKELKSEVASRTRDLEILRDFFRNVLNEKEVKNIDERLQKDKTFLSDFNWIKQEHQLGMAALWEDMETNITNWKASENDGREAKVISLGSVLRSPLLKWAASLILIPIGLLFFYAQHNFNSENISRTLADQAQFQSFMGGERKSLTLEDGLTAFYTDQDYSKAIDIFHSIPSADPDKNTATYFEAYSYFESNDYENALALFGGLNKTDVKGLDGQQLDWMVLLCKVALGGDDQMLLQEISKFKKRASGLYLDKAVELEEKINHPFRSLVLFR